MIDLAIEKFGLLLQGRIPDKIDTGKIADKSKQKFAEMLNQLIEFMQEIHNFIVPLSKGEIAKIKTSRNNFLASPFKELHSRLLHLTWQAQQIAKGDYSQRVEFMGDFSKAFNSMIISLHNKEKLLKKKIEELEDALSHIKNLEGILPICSNCKKIRVDGTDPEIQESWVSIENYISKKTNAKFSHSICPECMKKFYPDIKV
jgi:BMFP domain-containing protein YqiC